MIEDVIDTLIVKNVLNITDLPAEAQAKLFARKSFRERVSKNSLRLFADGDLEQMVRDSASTPCRVLNGASGAAPARPEPCVRIAVQRDHMRARYSRCTDTETHDMHLPRTAAYEHPIAAEITPRRGLRTAGATCSKWLAAGAAGAALAGWAGARRAGAAGRRGPASWPRCAAARSAVAGAHDDGKAHRLQGRDHLQQLLRVRHRQGRPGRERRTRCKTAAVDCRRSKAKSRSR